MAQPLNILDDTLSDQINMGTRYIQKHNVRLWVGRDSLHILDLSNAMKKGMSCTKISIVGADLISAWAAWNYLEDRFGTDMRKALQELSLECEKRPPLNVFATSSPYGTMAIQKSEEPSNRVFSPFSPTLLSPLKEMPAKWTIPHIVRALANNQFADFRCAGKMSDDYACDAAHGYYKGPMGTAMPTVCELVEDPSGWWASSNGDEVNFSCHTFESYKFKFVLNPPDPAQEESEGSGLSPR